jgi:uncharacterized phiE125 gp8 family phage protein
MTLYRTVEPAAEPVTLADVKAQLRVGHDSEDALLSGLIRAARDEVEAQAGVALIDQAWRLAFDRWPHDKLVKLRRYPVKEILSVTVYGAEGEAALVNAASYEADLKSRPARLHFVGPPPPEQRLNGIEIDFVAGFGEAGTDVPDLLKRAILVLVAHWYEFRAVYRAEDQPVSVPPGFDRLIAGYRTGRL